MTVGIYAIRHVVSNKRYIGKSKNIENRFRLHKSALSQPIRNEKNTNRHLWNAVQKYGLGEFDFEIIEALDDGDERIIAKRELYWMDYFGTCDRRYGYNLRRDSSTKMEVHIETRAMRSVFSLGKSNPNYGNNWSDEQKARMSETAKLRHSNLDVYGEAWREKIGKASTRLWQDVEKKRVMAQKVSAKKQQYDFEQYTKSGEFVRRWDSVKQIVAENPDYKWQNIYNVCHGHKPSYKGFVWKQVLKDRA